MTTFSMLLSKYIHRCNYTNQSFAKLCGIDRTLLQRYISGQRIPHSYEALSQMIEKLRLTPDEKREVEEVFERETIGDERFTQYAIIRELLESFDGKAEDAWSVMRQTKADMLEDHLSRLVQNKRDLLHTIWNILNEEAVREYSEIYLIGQPGMKELDVMLQGCMQTDSMTLHQLICVNPQTTSDGGAENIEILRTILPILSQPVHYDLRFYYGNARERFNHMNLLPNLLITQHFVVQFDTDFSKGIISSETDLRSFMFRKYKEMERSTRSFIVKHASVVEMVSYYQNLHPCDHSLQLQPCLAYSLSEEVLLSALKPETKELESIVKSLCSMLGEWAKHAAGENTYANMNFFTKEGLWDFMNTGRILEFPSMFYEPLPFAWRLRMLEIFLEQLKTGLIQGYIVKEEYMRINSGLVVQLTGGDAVHFILNNPNGSQTVLGVKESGLVQTFREYMEYLKDGRFVETREATIAWVEQQLDRYRTQE